METLHIDRNALVKVRPSESHFIFLDRERCDGCGDCAVICPMDLWSVRKGKASLSRRYRERCLECGSCFLACVKGAVDFRYPPAGSGVTYRFS
ncbi:4Fe-4S dicluster domain-containing protein [Candidatus Solincola tengchongensis]|uniref:4Fe-4S dicluster domain-containing protein n=1 Tax=Candidatus Solincola tengchongensis TaxID=2900693 RepID=UPI00257F015F|nr:4Fe-4S dicluster domain-containing protein [Candidatus Solincola tengchongensis]